MNRALCCHALILLCVALMAVKPASAGADRKPISLAVCKPYSMSDAAPASALKFRPSSIINDSTLPAYVICPIPKDSESDWTESSPRSLTVLFTSDKPGASYLGNVCSLYVGDGMAPSSSRSKTISAKMYAGDDVGIINFDEKTGPTGTSYEAATLICAIAPSNSMVYLYLQEG